MLFEFRDDTEKCDRGKNCPILSSCEPQVRSTRCTVRELLPAAIPSLATAFLISESGTSTYELSRINIILSPISCIRVGGVKVSIVAFQAIDPGSIPG